jgi:hypothetical protein
MMPSLLREPLLQFLVLGAALFGAHNLIIRKSAEEPAKIIISSNQIGNLADGFARTWRRKPSEKELQGLVEDYVRDEVFYREGRAAGLDRDDVVIRRRVRQKMEFLADDISALEPTEAELAAYLTSHSEHFRTEDRLTFRHIFLSATRRTSAIEADSMHLAKVLDGAGADRSSTDLGDPFLLGDQFQEMSSSDLAAVFGHGFAERISTVEAGWWQGPISSSFGQHFIFVRERTPGIVPPLNKIRQAVGRDWANARRLDVEQKLYGSIKARYAVVVEPPPANATLAVTQ